MTVYKTIHFVYATPYSLLDKITMRLFKRKLYHPSWSNCNWPVPLKAPLSITYQIAKHFSANYRIKLYDLKERINIEPEEGDILLGHAWPDTESVVWKALNSNKFYKKYMITPYNHDHKQISWAYEAVEKCDKYFAICGQYWINTFEKSPLIEFKEKIVRLNMGINTADYPVIKSSFSPPGKRKFFYIGRSGQEKGVDLLEKLVIDCPGFKGGYICAGYDIKGWEKISGPVNLTPDFMRKIADEYDVFINMSRADAQVTTVLESMSWGFPVACTKESGYSEEQNLFYMDLVDWDKNVELVQQIQEMSCQKLEEISRQNRKTVEAKYTWEQFVKTLEENI